jgi:hypothetical protein
VWAGDGDGNIIEAEARTPGAAVLRKIPRGGTFRVDEIAYDPVHQILMASNDGDSPPFLTFVSAKDGSVLGHYMRWPPGPRQTVKTQLAVRWKSLDRQILS